MQEDADRESLLADLAQGYERERAMRDILEVISQNRADDGPVFDAILADAERLCQASGSGLQLVNAARTRLTIVRNGPGSNKGSFVDGTTFDLAEPLAMCTAVREGKVQSIPDMRDTDLYREGHEGRRKLVDVEGVRAHLSVPLMRDGVAFGNITLSRLEPTPFRSDEIDLVETFAAQAVIAIENVRQFREVQTRLKRETATSEVLSAISQSRDDDQLVFDTLLEKAVTLSQSAHGSIWLVDKDGVWLESVARNEREAAQTAGFDRRRMDNTGSAVATCVREKSLRLIDDLQALPGYADPDFPNHAWISESGARSMLLVPLVSEGIGIGMLGMYRNEVRPYSPEDVAMIEGFAAQAVIAIENTRQFRALEVLNAELGDRVQEQVGEIERMGRLKRFLPAAVADTVITSGSEKMLSSHRPF